MSKNRFHARLAAASLLKMAKATADSELAAHFVALAANLKDHTGELPVFVGIEAPDRQFSLDSNGIY